MLAAARSLSRHSVPFLVLGVDVRSMVGVSRVARPHVLGRTPDAREEPEEFVASIVDSVRRHDVDLVLPTTDRTIYACVRHREVIEDEAPLAAPPTRAVLNVLDKKLNLETAHRLGIPCPVQFMLERIEQVPALIEQLGFPIVLKNPGPAADGQRPRFHFRWLVAHDEAQLREYLDQHCPAGAFPIVQQLVTGTVRNVCCFAVEGEIVAIHEYISLRRSSGYSVFREICPLRLDLRRYAEAMLRELRWTGVAHLGFFVRASDGDVRYMETNGRFWASLAGSVAAGWDFPYWTYDYFASGRRPEPRSLSHGVGQRSRWLYGDLADLVSHLGGDHEPGGAGRSRTRAVADYLSGFKPGTHADVFRLDDPLPELVEHLRGARLAISRYRHHR